MTDSLTIFGNDFTGVAGIKATGTGNGTLTYIRPQGTKSITSNGTGIDVTEYAAVNVAVSGGGSNLQAKTNISPTTSSQTITADAGYDGLSSVQINAMPSMTLPTAASGTSSGTSKATIGRSTSNQYINIPTGYNSSAAYYTVSAVANGTAGTPTASKGAVSNHSVSVTPSVTNTTGYITGGTKTGTAVTVSASELVSGSETKTANGTYDVTNLAELVVDVSGGGTSSVQVGTKTTTLSAEASSISFTGLSGNPSSFVITSQSDVATNTDGVTAVVYDGTSLHGQTMTTQVEADTGFTKSYSSGTLTITATTAQFQANAYKLAYTYSGSSSDIHTSDVQVGSGATSITFSSLSGRPMYWSCIFKSNFSTSSGYQRVIAVANDGSSIYGLDMDSSAHAATAWTATYSGGNLTISSGGTNNGGYFHQPGYYQLTYAVDGSAPEYQVKTVTPTTSTQNVYPDSGYDALEEVIVNAIPSQYIVPTGNIAITSNTTGSNTLNVSQYATATVNVPTSGSSMNVQTAQSTTRSTSTSGTSVISLTCSKAGTYTVRWSTFRSSTSGTWGSRLYIGGTAYETMDTSGWSNHIQNREVTGVSISANQAVAVYVQSRGSSYYGYVGTLTIIQTA